MTRQMFLDFLVSAGYKVSSNEILATCPDCGCEFEVQTKFYDHATEKSKKESYGKAETKKSRAGKKARAGFAIGRY